MPELPEVETIVRGLAPGVSGRTIARAELLFPPLLRRPPKGGLAVLAGRRVLGARRRGKMALLEVEGGLTLVFHLKMTGQLLLAAPGAAPPDRHTRLVVTFRDGGSELRFRDVRKFGFLLCVRGEPERACPELSSLGPEPLGLAFEDFRRAVGRRKGRIKSLLLDQTVVAGIGNIYADETLFDAGVHPETPAPALTANDLRRLWESARKILARAIEAKGSSLSDYVDAEGREGSYQEFHQVYGRAGEPCGRCGRPVRRTVVGGRGTYCCPRCQRKARRRLPR
ncbi:MAG TPA: bifunctional DNA-formamidopyrimidine glycosylase/DNA-(apurinic or apyrimidinic site) lyase [Terriglobales bacterium]|nr:bifunctional DNA-formamidopyrimidine glycosylase/DNA-(apurinic or apyrimidinic site) lyase [Terriglobales bacterium]